MTQAMTYAPIGIFAYKRLEHLKKVISRLQMNYLAPSSELFVCSNAPAKEEENEVVNNIREYASSITGFKNVTLIINPINKGGSEHAIKNITNLVKTYKKIIVLNDDDVPTKNFLNYMNEALVYYEENKSIFSIGAYSLPLDIDCFCDDDVYFLPRMCTWGWGIWEDRWMNMKWDLTEADIKKCHWFKFNRGGYDLFRLCLTMVNGNARLDALCTYAQYVNDLVTVYPKYGFITNIGFDGSGENCGVTDKYRSLLIDENKVKFKFSNGVVINRKILKRFKKYWGNFFYFFLVDCLPFVYLPLRILKRLLRRIIVYQTIGRNMKKSV
jgi:hypothetical protein